MKLSRISSKRIAHHHNIGDWVQILDSQDNVVVSSAEIVDFDASEPDGSGVYQIEGDEGEPFNGEWFNENEYQVILLHSKQAPPTTSAALKASHKSVKGAYWKTSEYEEASHSIHNAIELLQPLDEGFAYTYVPILEDVIEYIGKVGTTNNPQTASLKASRKSAGTWALPETIEQYDEIIKELRALQDKYYDILGDDAFFDYLDGAVAIVQSFKQKSLLNTKDV